MNPSTTDFLKSVAALLSAAGTFITVMMKVWERLLHRKRQ